MVLRLAKVVAMAMLVVRNGFIIRLVLLLAVILLAWFLRNIPPCTMLRLVEIGIFDNLHQKNAPAYYGIKAGKGSCCGDVSGDVAANGGGDFASLLSKASPHVLC